MAKTIAFNQDAREAIRRGVGKLTKAVRSTLGPCGHTVLLAKSFGPPTVTKDGVTVAKEIDLEDPFENIGAKMVREVASKTNDVAGDGTTTATVLADAIFNEGLRAVVAGVNPVYLKNGIEKAVVDVVAKLKSNSVKVKGQTEMARVAAIAANNGLSFSLRMSCGRNNWTVTSSSTTIASHFLPYFFFAGFFSSFFAGAFLTSGFFSTFFSSFFSIYFSGIFSFPNVYNLA